MVRWHHQLNGHELEQTLGGNGGQESLECCSPWGHKESDATWQLNNSCLKCWKETHLWEKSHFILCFLNYILQTLPWFLKSKHVYHASGHMPVGVCWPNTMPRILASLCPSIQQLELSCPLLVFQPAEQFPVVWGLNFLGHFRLELWRNGFKPLLLLFSVQWWERNKSDRTSLTPK